MFQHERLLRTAHQCVTIVAHSLGHGRGSCTITNNVMLRRVVRCRREWQWRRPHYEYTPGNHPPDVSNLHGYVEATTRYYTEILWCCRTGSGARVSRVSSACVRECDISCILFSPYSRSVNEFRQGPRNTFESDQLMYETAASSDLRNSTPRTSNKIAIATIAGSTPQRKPPLTKPRGKFASYSWTDCEIFPKMNPPRISPCT